MRSSAGASEVRASKEPFALRLCRLWGSDWLRPFGPAVAGRPERHASSRPSRPSVRQRCRARRTVRSPSPRTRAIVFPLDPSALIKTIVALTLERPADSAELAIPLSVRRSRVESRIDSSPLPMPPSHIPDEFYHLNGKGGARTYFWLLRAALSLQDPCHQLRPLWRNPHRGKRSELKEAVARDRSACQSGGLRISHLERA